MAVNNSNIDAVVERLREGIKQWPDPSVTLVGKRWKDPFFVLIACILSLRTKDETTLPASERLFSLADSPESMLKLKILQIEQAIYPVGFYRTKARTIHRICRDLIERYESRVPDSIDELLTMHGVGRKTANLVVTEGFGKLGVCVDTHVHRISNRFGYVKTASPEKTEWALRKKLPEQYWIDYNTLLVIWGQNVCRPISPLCSRCAVFDMCQRRGVLKSR